MNDVKLLPCPFCGSDDVEEYYSDVDFTYGTVHQHGSVDCNQCGVSIHKEAYGNDAVDTLSKRLVEAWNKRI